MSTSEAAEAAAAGEGSAVGAGEPDAAPAPPRRVSDAVKKALTKELLRRLFAAAEHARLSPKVAKVLTNCIRSTETRSSAAEGSVIGLVYEIFQSSDFHLAPRQIWALVRELFPKTDHAHWKTGSEVYLINVGGDFCCFCTCACVCVSAGAACLSPPCECGESLLASRAGTVV